jgi:hypothetical protein
MLHMGACIADDWNVEGVSCWLHMAASRRAWPGQSTGRQEGRCGHCAVHARGVEQPTTGLAAAMLEAAAIWAIACNLMTSAAAKTAYAAVACTQEQVQCTLQLCLCSHTHDNQQQQQLLWTLHCDA